MPTGKSSRAGRAIHTPLHADQIPDGTERHRLPAPTSRPPEDYVDPTPDHWREHPTKFLTEENNPDLDISPSEEYSAYTDGTSTFFYPPSGKLQGRLPNTKTEDLWNRFNKAARDGLHVGYNPGSFAKEVCGLMTRYVDGERTDASGRATNVKDHWALPKGVIEALSELYSTNTHRFASPLNIDSRDITVTYYTPYKRDALFGASYDAYSCQWRGASLAHPTFSAKEAHKALQWALRSAASTTEATLTILALPPKFEHDRDDAEYQRLLKHKGAQILFSIKEMPFQHSNFTESLQKYRYPTPCLIVLVCNDAGHDNFCISEDDPRWHTSLAKLLATIRYGKEVLVSGLREAGKPQFKASLPPLWQRIPPQPACNPTPPYDNTDIQTPHISARNLAWAGTEIVYTDGSAKDGKAGAGIILADSHIRVRMPEGGTSLKAELVAIASALKASQKDFPLFVATDCLVALHAIRNSLDDRTYARTFKEWQALEHAMSALHARHAETTFLKVKAHAGIAGNEMADREATAARKLDEHVEEELDGGIRVEDYVDEQPDLPVITMPAGGPVDPKWAKNLTHGPCR